MYKKPFYLTKPIWNNAFSFNNRKNKQLYIPSITKIQDFDDIKIQEDKNKIAFEDFWFDDKMSTNYWLENFYEIDWKGKTIYLFDNHNHAFYFWYLAKSKWVIKDNTTLIHIDEHADTRDNNKYIENDDVWDLEKVFNFTNEVLNVGDYIIPAQKQWLIGDIIQIRNESNLIDYINHPLTPSLPRRGNETEWKGVVLNLDLDFFQPDLDFIDYDLKKRVILDAAEKANVITVATSPFFIEQELALKKFKDIFS